ncbi:major facilitator superfamily domain-containing protein [Phellopilus nigrolimitatus]|nr:major facilitator superfamily domain-containing protein [Phellopilus nigrolimitatus]
MHFSEQEGTNSGGASTACSIIFEKKTDSELRYPTHPSPTGLDDTEKQVQDFSKAADLNSGTRPNAFRKHIIIPILCSAQFFDIFSSSSSIIALPEIGQALNFSASELQWVVAAYTLTFASLQLIGGRLSDIYYPKPVFIAGCTIVGVFSILCAVSVDPIMLIVFRAVQGIGAGFTIPPAISLIVQTRPNPTEQSLALAAFAAFGAMGNALGFVLGGILTSRVGWKWVFYIVAIMILPLAALSVLILPGYDAKANMTDTGKERRLDLPGVCALTGGLILFVYAISDASNIGWDKPQIIVTLILSMLFMLVFFLIERKVNDPAVPPSTWFIPNVIPLFIYSLGIYWFLYGTELQLVEIFQDLFGWSALKASVHCIPIGVAGGITSYLFGTYGPRFSRRISLPVGQLLMGVGSVLFALADTPEKYWSHVFPGMVVGMIGIAISYVGVNVAVMASARKGEEGVVGALVNTSFQLGATIGLAVMTSITIGVNDHLPGNADALAQFTGYRDAFWLLVGMHGLLAIVSLVFVK